MTAKLIILSYCVISLIAVLLVVNSIVIKCNGTPVAVPDIPRETLVLGSGKQLNFVVIGDSTSIGQGAEYTQSYAYKTAEHLARSYEVHFTNLGVSGAKTGDVANLQLPNVTDLKPDLVLLAVGANDVTHFTSKSTVKSSLTTILTSIKSNNPKAKIVITGSPAMGSVARFPWPAKQIAGMRAARFNSDIFKPIASKNSVVFAPIAEKTGEAFAANPTLFAADKFHPNAQGYALWTPVVIEAVEKSLGL